MIRLRGEVIIRAACVLALVALALMVWSLLDPRAIPVIIAMSAGQVLGTMSLAAFLVVVIADLRGQPKSKFVVVDDADPNAEDSPRRR